ncbi:MAG: DEAD/DEAH box helicase [Sporomusaceae bacterium]|nr:DEAD/DEAH box helicase [Sporomusaceae bacterium]
MLTDEIIRSEAAGGSYAKGRDYYRDGAVRSVRFFSEANRFTARVTGWNFYSVAIGFDKQRTLRDYECDCPAFHSYPGACKHVVAVLLHLQAEWSSYFDGGSEDSHLPLSSGLKRFLAHYRDNLEPSPQLAAEQVRLVPVLGFSPKPGRKNCWLEFMIGSERLYVVKDITHLLDSLLNGQELIYGKSFSLRPRQAAFVKPADSLIALLLEAYAEEKERAGWSYSASAGSAFADPRRFRLTNANLLRFFSLMQLHPFSIQMEQQPPCEVKLCAERPPVSLSVDAVKGGLQLTADLAGDVLYGLDTDCRYLYHRQCVYQVDDAFARRIKPVLRCFADTGKAAVTIPAAAVSDFVETVLPALESVASVRMDAAVYSRFSRLPLEKRVYLDRYGDGISAKIELKYGDQIFNPAEPAVKHQLQTTWLLRSTLEERQLLQLFQKHGFIAAAGRLVQPDEAATYEFLQQTLPELQEMASVYCSDAIKPVAIRRIERISAGVSLNQTADMLEFSLDYGDFSPKLLIELLSAYKLKKRYHRLRDGSFVPLDSPQFQAAAALISQLGLRAADLEKPVVSLPKYRALYLDSVAREAGGIDIASDSGFSQLVREIRQPQNRDWQVPAGIRGSLRAYQQTGFKWLKSLAVHGFGGILADDMGLGKTLQVLTLLLHDKISGVPSLVIAPTSLLYNWQEEAARFAPELNVVVVSGQQTERQEQLRTLAAADLIVTSYGLVKRDIELYKRYRFRYCFLDEAQNVKNPDTMSAKAVKQIHAGSRFALTGTPIENSLTELWSIFDFVMPGYLRSRKQFSSRFENPIARDGDPDMLRELNRHTQPFILRRMKKNVLNELPPKIESKLNCEMTDEQAKLYAAWLLQTRADFEQELADNGFGGSRIKILSLLTRLRQICCHPSLFLENYQGGSGKLEALWELLQEALAGGRRVLLFSQFTAMLALISRQLEAAGISYYYLDGATKAQERLTLANSFNAGERSVFLISLKAGGTGLNLTGADMVVHFDPWWNPAVEDQATDRAYRIGQKNSVQVYKLIARGTIEDKIFKLQQKKKELIDALIRPGENFLSKMSEEEIRDLFRQ